MLYFDNPILMESRIEQIDRMADPIPVSECKLWPDEDLYGSVIATNDDFYILDDYIVHYENLERFVVEKKGAICMTKK